MKKILILNGPNLNLLHKRDKKIYGDISLDKIAADCEKLAKELGVRIEFQQSNNEGELVDIIQNAAEEFDGLIINAAAYTHTSIAIRDALEIFSKPKIELHISNIFKREEFRQHSFLSDVVDATISGLGVQGYTIALLAMNSMI
ncbi:MAG: type II 3-dehydroquinate dehydratase [Alphaproteobacteria bacterium RIFCSPLOWO2_01_FULL_40_26]|nr:MAG: type II 3-dehydroquinate dehydratase [Alphaproteobacteria bacterium RIFCSPHIGHO2_02_FULL_40_34]OFW94251.1 MAG: type II 3-dehydroquinate dehydratase [Alphaproteobacteria bacterium RIFCSPLOWO2_01_FULL_40_26]OFX09820.1 MAG: type II 3-dehydroquinate dehydratase [Alphaproteobacteria bacterium RIFCSPLOWO2_02_FULL_40_19]OFX11403.1 MAG: type II 3-dehydroquinate dehydratase [Alphaproteobacteria bacterium RIFCSPLOWO2_12_FULL_40_11]